MGEPKPLVEIGGRPMLARIVATVGSAGLEPVVVAKPDSPLPKVDCRCSASRPSRAIPLTGLLTALRASAGRAVVAIACDMPLVPAKLLTWISQLEEEVAVCEVGARSSRCSAATRRRRSTALDEALAAGASMREAVGALNPFVIGEASLARFADPARIVFNVNSPEDVATAEDLLAGPHERRRPPRAPPRRRDARACRRAVEPARAHD